MSIALKVILFLGVMAICIAGLRFFFYESWYVPSLIKEPGYADITVTTAPPPSWLAEAPGEGKGIVVIDLAHDNNLTPAEINPLILKIVSRGSGIEYLRKDGNEAKSPVLEELEEKLRLADALVVILPGASYSEDEVRLVEEFVNKGGKLLLIADPTRTNNINSVSSDFGLVFESGYLYNLTENEGNFRNIIISQFARNELTRSLAKIVFYTAGHISPSVHGVVFTDENTSTSIEEIRGKFAPVALVVNSKVLAIADFTFMTEPHNVVYDNNQFISNIADWLAQSERQFSLADFPYFIGDDAEVMYSDSLAVDMATGIKGLLNSAGKEAAISQHKTSITPTKDTVFLGLFKAARAVESYLDQADISINTGQERITVEIGTMGNVYKEGTSLLYLTNQGDKRLLLVLADTEDMLEETTGLLESGEFRQWLVTDQLAICRSKQLPKAEVPAEETEEE